MMTFWKEYNFNEWQPAIIKKRKNSYCDDIMCFDIEVTSYFVNSGKVYSLNDVLTMPDNDGKIGNSAFIEKFFEESENGATPYIWQFCINDDVLYGRDFSEVLDVLKIISEKIGDARGFIFVHNLSYEWVFLRELLHDYIDKALLTEARKILYFDAFGNLQFRCTYRLTNLSIAKWGQSLDVQKKTGDLDYGVLRSPLTETLTEKELSYCEFDLRVMVAGLRKFRAQYGTLENIPLTQTGRVRREVKTLNAKVKGRCAFIAECQPHTTEEMSVQNRCFMGGLTLANVERANKVLRGVLSKDIASAYPYVMFARKYPASRFLQAPFNGFEYMNDGNHHIILVTFTNLHCKYNIGVIPYSKRITAAGVKCDGENGDELSNGKILTAASLTMYLTEVDYLSYEKLYTWENATVYEHWAATSDYMPADFIQFMLQLYSDKTKLKHADPALYMRAKEMLNSLYGMCATLLYHHTFTENDFTPTYDALTVEDIQAALDEFQNKTYKNVVPYSWGVYVTAYQRARIINAIAYFCERGESHKVCYIDTDSLKGFFDDNEQYFTDENKRVEIESHRICLERNIPLELVAPTDEDGKPHHLGKFETDGLYYDFKTLGAKRYAYREDEKDKVHITIAGVPKVAGSMLASVDDLQEYDEKTKTGLYFDIFHSHKSLSEYKDGNNPLVTFPDGYEVKNTCAVNIRPTTYKLTLTSDYRELLRRFAECYK